MKRLRRNWETYPVSARDGSEIGAIFVERFWTERGASRHARSMNMAAASMGFSHRYCVRRRSF